MGCRKLTYHQSVESQDHSNGFFSHLKVVKNLVSDSEIGVSSYAYGFNGMEKDDEVKGEGNSYTTMFRQLDPRLGRWLSIDPVTHHHFSPYSTFDNNPIYFADPSGADSEGGEGDPEKTYVTAEPLEEFTVVASKTETASSRGVSIEDANGSLAATNNYWSEYSSRNGQLNGGDLWGGKRKDEYSMGVYPSRPNGTKDWNDYDQKMEEWRQYYVNYEVSFEYSAEPLIPNSYGVTLRDVPQTEISLATAYDNYLKTTQQYSDMMDWEMPRWDIFSAAIGIGVAPPGSGNLRMPKNFNYQRQFSHSGSRMLKRGITDDQISDAFNNPLLVKKVKLDKLGRPSQTYIGRSVTAVKNPNTGKTITTWPTSTKLVKKLTK